MKKIYRSSQIHLIIGEPVYGDELYKFGIPYYCSSGGFFPYQPDRIDMMLAVTERHPEVHVMSCLQDYREVNRYESGARYYRLYYGNPDPDIEFEDEFSLDDFPPEEVKRFIKFLEDNADKPFTIEQVAAVNFALDTVRNFKKD